MTWWTPLLQPQPPVALPDWWPWHLAVEAPTPLARAALAAARADRLAAAFTSGYQAALEACFDERVRGALAVTEAGGGHPRAIETTLVDGRLTGTKVFVSAGPQAEVVWVVARAGEQDGRPALKVARLPSGGPGQRWSEGPTPPFVPEVAHGVLHLDDAPVDKVLDGDGYLDVVKPFRTVEDLHVLAAALGHALGEAARNGSDPDWRDDALSTLLSLAPLAAADPRDPAVHHPLDACFRRAGPLLDAAPWSDPDRWQRDRALLGVASRIRATRTARARSAFP
jgi:hypothetical protein